MSQAVLYRAQYLRFSFVLAACAFLAPRITLAAYECPNPNTDEKTKIRCEYNEAAYNIYLGWLENAKKVTKQNPKPGLNSAAEIISVYGPIAKDCLYGYQSQPKSRLYNCARGETYASGCVGPSKNFSSTIRQYMMALARCENVKPANKQKCKDRVENTFFKKLRDIGNALYGSVTKRVDTLNKEYNDICLKKPKCKAPAIAALHLSTASISLPPNPSCNSLGNLGLINGLYGTNTGCDMCSYEPTPTPTPEPEPTNPPEPDPTTPQGGS